MMSFNPPSHQWMLVIKSLVSNLYNLKRRFLMQVRRSRDLQSADLTDHNTLDEPRLHFVVFSLDSGSVQ